MTSAPPFAAHHRASDNAWQSLDQHLLGVAALARRFAAKFGMERQGELLGLLHDLGKYSGDFQTYLKSAIGELNPDEDEDWVDAKMLRGKIDHSSAGAQTVWRSLTTSKHGVDARQTSYAAQVLALCIASHHSGLIDCIGGDGNRDFGENLFSRRMDKSVDKTHVDEAIGAAHTSVLQRCRELLEDKDLSARLWSDLCKIKEANSFPILTGPNVFHQQLGLSVRMLFSCLIDADRIDTANFEHRRTLPRADYPPWETLVERLQAHLRGLAPGRDIDRLRNQISENCRQRASGSKGLFTLTVPTGGGKTLASLRFALHHASEHKLDRILFVIPFTSIIDQNASDVRKILDPGLASGEQGRVVLEHHASLTPEQQTWREKILCESWDAPIVFTTMVQFLECLFGAGTRGARRMHQLANAVVVFDEIQTLPIKCVHLFNNSVNYLVDRCSSTVVMCTATQPLLDQVTKERGAIKLNADHELMPDVPQLFDLLKRVELHDRRKPGGWSYEEIADLAISELCRAGSCLVIVNTKDAARQIFERCFARLGENGLFHLSTDMCPAHRRAVLGSKQNVPADTVIGRLTRGEPVLCVSTQLIEAGVDVDFGAVVRSMAGLDSIVQAAGRCNRHGASSVGSVHVVDARDERLDSLWDIVAGRRAALRVMDDFKFNPTKYGGNLVSPKALEDYYRYYFFDRREEMIYALGDRQIGRDDSVLSLLTDNKQAVDEYGRRNATLPNLPLRQAFMTAAKAFHAIDAPTQGIVVPYGEEGKKLIADLHVAFKLDGNIELLRRAQQYTVNVFPHMLKRLQDEGAVRPVSEAEFRVFCLDARYYSPRFGLSTDVVKNMESLVL